MPNPLLTEKDIAQIKSRGVNPEKVLSEIESFRRGFLFADLSRPATVGDGIITLGESDVLRLAARYSEASLSGRAMKFVPASGSATRMFQRLLSLIGREGEICLNRIRENADRGDLESREFVKFAVSLAAFPFYRDLKATLSAGGRDIDSRIREGRYREVLYALLSEAGLNYANLPKGLIKFHIYPGGASRTAFEEHLVEAADYVRDRRGAARIHFTVPADYEARIRQFFSDALEKYESPDVRFDITFSVQDPATDTVAVDLDNRPFRDSDGGLVFRPGGHGALLRNLSALDGDIIFIKNVDNVLPEELAARTFVYKKALGGYLTELQEGIFARLRKLVSGDVSEGEIQAIFQFTRDKLSIIPPQGIEAASPGARIEFLVSKLNRPARVCGMVKNEGEPGGGPFWARGLDEAESLQIVESSQVDAKSPRQKAIWESSTHFNPVDIVCGVRNYLGENFDLSLYSDPNSGFISIKSKDGRPLKALELPGLWNGGMADWITVFVEAPIATFNPVKTVFDLLRNEHRAA